MFATLVVYPLDRAEEVLRAYRGWTDDLTDEVTSLVVCGCVPAEEGFPSSQWGAPCVILVACAATDLDLGGAVARVAADATAYGDRSAPFLLGVEANWSDPVDDDANLAWTRGCTDAFATLSTGRPYLNFPGFLEEGEAAVRAALGQANHDRLRALKRRLDPDNRFRLHQNVPPA